MQILTENTGSIPYTSTKHEIMSIGNGLTAGAGQVLRTVSGDEIDGSPKRDLYFSTEEQTIKKWTVAEALKNYKDTIHVDIERKSFEYTSRLDYKLRYYNDIVAKGGTLTAEQSTSRVALATESTTIKDYIHNKVQVNEAATTKAAVEVEYNIFLAEYRKKMNELEGVL